MSSRTPFLSQDDDWWLIRVRVTVGYGVSIGRVILSSVAVLCGLAATGCFLLLQLGGVTKAEGPATALIMYGAAVGFVASSVGAAYLREERAKNGWERSLFLFGALGLPAPPFYVAVSNGEALELPQIDLLIAAFVGLIVLFRAKATRTP
jgi:hypothetical protein